METPTQLEKYTGYIDCDLAIVGLQQQGKNLDRSTFAESLRSIGEYNLGGGLNCAKSNFSLEVYGKVVPGAGRPAPCTYVVRVKGGKFQVVKPSGGKTPYWTGKIITDSVPPELLTTASGETTTTAGK